MEAISISITFGCLSSFISCLMSLLFSFTCLYFQDCGSVEDADGVDVDVDAS